MDAADTDASPTPTGADASADRSADASADSADASAASSAGDAAPAQGWMSYGYDLSNTQYNPHETVLNAGNVAALQEKWRVNVAGGATGTPVVYDGKAYFTAWNGRVYAVDVRTAEISWQSAITNMLIRSSPLVTEDRVFVGSFNSLVALDRRDGKLLFETRLHPHPLTVIDSSPKLIDGLVIIGVASMENTALQEDYTFIGAVVAIDATTGAEVWRVATSGDQGVCVGGAGVAVWSSAAFDRELGLAYIGTGQNYEEPFSNCADSLLAIHYGREHQGERVAWAAQYTKNDVFLSAVPFLGIDADVGAAPNLFEAGGKRLVGAGDKGGSYRAFDRMTGALVWRADLDHGENVGAGGVMTTAAVHDGSVYLASNRWNVVDAVVGVESVPPTSTLYALDTATGKERWHVALPAPTVGTFALANGLLYHPIMSGTLYARELTAGKELWSVDLGLQLGAGPSVWGGRVYISAGMTIQGANAELGFVSSFELAETPGTPPTIVNPPTSPREPLTQDQCETALKGRDKPACSDCLCECDATAWGYCDLCWDLSLCPLLLCSLAAPGADLAACVQDSCAVKLLPPAIMDSLAETTPCAIKCNGVCGFL